LDYRKFALARFRLRKEVCTVSYKPLDMEPVLGAASSSIEAQSARTPEQTKLDPLSVLISPGAKGTHHVSHVVYRYALSEVSTDDKTHNHRHSSNYPQRRAPNLRVRGLWAGKNQDHFAGAEQTGEPKGGLEQPPKGYWPFCIPADPF